MIFGSRETVVRRLTELRDALGINYLMCQFAVGQLPHEKVLKAMERFAKEVMPALNAAPAVAAGKRA